MLLVELCLSWVVARPMEITEDYERKPPHIRPPAEELHMTNIHILHILIYVIFIYAIILHIFIILKTAHILLPHWDKPVLSFAILSASLILD